MAHHVELAFSRDGIHYDRRYQEPFTQRGARSEFYFKNCKLYSFQFNWGPSMSPDKSG